MEKPREWNIQLLHGKPTCSSVYMNAENVHVIEYSAYEAERAKVKELENELAYYKNGTQIKTIVIDDAYITENISLQSENQALRDELMAAREVLYDYWCDVGGKDGKEALSRLDKFLNNKKA